LCTVEEFGVAGKSSAAYMLRTINRNVAASPNWAWIPGLA